MLDLNVDLISSDSSCDHNNNNNNNSNTGKNKFMMIIEQEASRRNKLIEQEEYSSGTSNSSILSTEQEQYEEDEEEGDEQQRQLRNVTDHNSSSSFTFDVVKSEKKQKQLHSLESSKTCFGENDREFVTRQLFPVNGEGGGGGGGGSVDGGESGELRLGIAAAVASKPQWLNLSFGESGGKEELRILQQKQQQVRKSRRGPRSRSSQYRGVTFYRRTGRWESHIWCVGDSWLC